MSARARRGCHLHRVCANEVRHPDCYQAFRYYHAKLEIRKRGTFVDLRFEENQLPTMVVAVAKHVDPEPEILALPAPAEVATDERGRGASQRDST